MSKAYQQAHSQVRPHDHHFVEAGRDHHEVWRSKHTIVFMQSAPAGETHLYIAWNLLITSAQEIRDEKIGSDQNLERMVDLANKYECEHCNE
jgi:diadenosine tetraphosphate (Ap4A) HIT family hydrolase